MSFGGDVKLSILGNLSATEDFLVNWVIPGKTVKKTTTKKTTTFSWQFLKADPTHFHDVLVLSLVVVVSDLKLDHI